MNLDDFQKHAVSTVAITQKDVTALAHRGFGLTGEAGIVADILKKIIRDKNGKALAEDVAAIQKRLGDVLYYTAVLADYFDLSLSDIADQNMQQSSTFKAERPTK